MKSTPLSSISSLQFPAFPSPAGAHQLAFQFMLEQSERWPLEVMRDHQCIQLKLLLEHAVKTSPYYRELFAKHQVTIPETIGHDFLATLPISLREDLQAAGDKLTSTALPKEHGATRFSTTSGSTGRPLSFGKSAVNQMIWLALTLRDNLWHRENLNTKTCVIRWMAPGKADPPHGYRTPTWSPEISMVFKTGEAVVLNVKSKPAEQLEWLYREKPDWLLSLPSNFAALTDYAEQQGLNLPSIKSLRTYGEMLPQELRERLTSAWKTKVVDMYSCEEAGYLALQCPDHDHYHVQSESVWLEIVDEAGKPCPPGVTGRVLITNLNNFVTPLIRYDIGDYAEFGEPCSCGRNLPVIRRIHGRKRNRFILPTGESISPSIGERKMVALIPGLKISQFRCIQHTTSMLELQLVADRAITAEEQTQFGNLIRENLDHPFEVTFSFPSHIDRGPTGKFETFISHVATGRA